MHYRKIFLKEIGPKGCKVFNPDLPRTGADTNIRNQIFHESKIIPCIHHGKKAGDVP